MLTEDVKGDQKMFTYYLAKARQNQLLREAEQDRLVKAAKRARKEAGALRSSQVGGWGNRRLHATRV